MGGSKGSSSSSSSSASMVSPSMKFGLLGCICQICEEESHLADKCPFLCAPCEVSGCNGILKLWTSNTEKNPGRKFLRCHLRSCDGFKWLDNAVESLRFKGADANLARKGSSAGKEIRVVNNWGKCFHCDLSGHWKKDCPWIDPTACRRCNGPRVLLVSNSSDTPGRRYLRCQGCGHFKWLSEEIEGSGDGLRVTIEGKLSELCDLFNRKM